MHRFMYLTVLCVVLIAALVTATENLPLDTKPGSVQDQAFFKGPAHPSSDPHIPGRPPPNAIPSLYPDRYAGYNAPQVSTDIEIPSSFNWCQTKYGCVASWQQHAPIYTPLCFLHASLTMVADRIKKAIHGMGIPDIYLSRQDYLDFSNSVALGQGLGGGGEGVDVMEYMRQYGIPDETCNPFTGNSNNNKIMPQASRYPSPSLVTDKDHDDSSFIPPTSTKTEPIAPKNNSRCTNCMMLYNDNVPHCWSVDTYIRYYISSYNHLTGPEAMQREIMTNGPITCGIVVDDEFIYGYHGEVYDDHGRAAQLEIDHDVEVVGWGEEVDNKTGEIIPTWIIRNSWGTSFFGTNGMFKIKRGSNVLRLEEKCLFANVDISELVDHTNGKNIGTMFGLIDPKTDKPRLKPPAWKKLPHEYTSQDELDKMAKETLEQEAWIKTYVDGDNTTTTTTTTTTTNPDLSVPASVPVPEMAADAVIDGNNTVNPVNQQAINTPITQGSSSSDDSSSSTNADKSLDAQIPPSPVIVDTASILEPPTSSSKASLIYISIVIILALASYWVYTTGIISSFSLANDGYEPIPTSNNYPDHSHNQRNDLV